MSNMAIFDPEAPRKILEAAVSDYEWGMAWCAVMQGMHPSNILALRPKNFDGEFLSWVRVKNEKPRRVMVDPNDRDRLEQFLEVMARKKPTRQTVWERLSALTAAAGYKGGPRVLRKTFILNALREHGPDATKFVARLAGCGEDVVIDHYLDLQQWEKIHKGRRS